MKLLILGGTIFLGRYLVEHALERGHDVTLFNRGKHAPDLFPGVHKLRGDRDGDLTALQARSWDAVIDTCGYLPRIVRASAELLADRVQHYTFISSISVYEPLRQPGMDESAPLGTLADPHVEDITGETYGPLKALCEQAAEQAMPGRVLQIRPGLIVGPHDYSERFTYWPRRIGQGGEVLAPGEPTERVQFIDVRDLANWTIHMVEARQTGVYNATGPDYPLTMGQFLTTCQTALDSDATTTWVDESFLLQAGVNPWTELPLWLPTTTNPEFAGFQAVDCSKALAAGLTFRPLTHTIHDTRAWDAERDRVAEQADMQRAEQPTTLSRERESELLQAWHRREQ